MQPIFELDEILQQDIHEDGLNESSIEQQTTPSMINTERSRTYSDSSLASIDGDDNISTIRSKKQFNKNHLVEYLNILILVLFFVLFKKRK